MIKILILSLCLISARNVLASTELAQPENNTGSVSNMMEHLSEHTSSVTNELVSENNTGSVSNMMEHLSEHTSSVTNELVSQLAAKIERTTKTLVGNIEVVITSALNQLAQPIEDFQNNIKSSQCQPLITLEELQQRVNSDLSKCTQNLKDIVNTFQTDANEFNVVLEENVKEIIELPKQCEDPQNDTGFGSNVSCYVDKIAKVNQQIAVVLNSASMTLVHTRQLGEQAVQEGRDCADNVVATTVEYIDKMLASCQLIEQ